MRLVGIVLAIDIGGTFTDLAVYLPGQGRVLYAKSPTTYGNFAEGVVRCIDRVGLDLRDAAFFKHGTTLVINTLIERTGARTALVTTRGFRDVLEFGRGSRPEAFNLLYRRDEPLVPRELRFEVTERITGQGTELVALDEEELRDVAKTLKEIGVEAVAVSFLNAYRNPTHEAAAKAALAQALPDLFVTARTDLSMEWYEYEATSTAVANAYVGPRVQQYVTRLRGDLADKGFRGRFFLTGSNGGVQSVQSALSTPLYLVESGPVGGCIGAAALGKLMNFDNLIAFDMGGTTAKCALVENGRFGVQNRYYVGGYDRGFPVQVPVLDIVEVGAGGGSIAWLDEVSGLHVGPRSAGSDPGPVAYGWGGTEPTVTDANVVLGRLDSRNFLGGELVLDVESAYAAIQDRIAAPLGLSGDKDVTRLAAGILSITTVIMAGAIKRITLERGRDPRDYALFAYGGAGPLHAVELARELRIPWVVVPPEPGNFSAVGMLLADARRDDARTYAGLVTEEWIPGMLISFAALEQEAAENLVAELGPAALASERFAEIRYRGQQHSVLTPLTGIETLSDIRRVFEQTYRQRYGHSDPSSPIETVNLHVVTVASIQKPDLGDLRLATEEGAPDKGSRPIYFPGLDEPVEARILNRERMPPGFTGDGPAVIEEYGSTTVIGPQDRFEVGWMGEIRIQVGGRAGGSDQF